MNKYKESFKSKQIGFNKLKSCGTTTFAKNEVPRGTPQDPVKWSEGINTITAKGYLRNGSDYSKTVGCEFSASSKMNNPQIFLQNSP